MWLVFSASFGHFSTPRIPWIIGAILLVFMDPKKPLFEKRNRFILVLAQDLILCHYGIAGLWKIINMFKLDSVSEVIYSFYQTPLDHLAYVAATGSGRLEHIQLGLIAKPLIPWLFVGFVLLQLSAFVAIVHPPIKKLVAYALILFHVMMGVVMGLQFDYTIAAILFQIILIEDLFAREKRLHDSP